jgi:hypothetical protein
MADTSRWRLAKRVFTAVMADGISLEAGPEVLDASAAAGRERRRTTVQDRG